MRSSARGGGRRLVVTVFVASVVALAVGSCSPGARSLVQQADNAGSAVSGARTLDDLAPYTRELDDLGRTATGADERAAVRAANLAHDAQLELIVDALAAQAARLAYAEVQAQAPGIARAATGGRANSVFLDDLTAMTEEAIKGAACDAIADLAFPTDQVATESGDEQGWQGDLVDILFDRLRGRYAPEDLNAVMDWASWAQGVGESADQAATAVAADPDAYVPYLARPQVLRGTVEYAKFCHGPPR